MQVSYTELLTFLRKNSFEEVETVRQSADFSVKGDTITWWPVDRLNPFRLRFFGEDLELVEELVREKWVKNSTVPDRIPNGVLTEHGTIRPGEYVVHPYHGVGILENIQSREVQEEKKLFISLLYAGNDRLLFPFDRHSELMPYIGSRNPRLTRLYSQAWKKTKERIEKDLIKIARELLKIYAKRQLVHRDPYEKADEWLAIISEEAGFTLTEDQVRTLKEIQVDFQASIPMDRLICGDVGFGKTELALRAATQVMASGKQVAFIAPTTVLAEQHYQFLQKRFASLPIVVEHISRLTSGKDKQTLEKIQNGGIDILVGTHRLLGKDIHFKDLGLLILDEEQKFGVDQKETLKTVRPNIDVLSLSATPIPRTLSLSLSGIRSLSILRTPPRGRLPVTTEVDAYSDKRLQNALKPELERGGQTYVVHNRVQSLPLVLGRVENLISDLGRKPVRFSDGFLKTTRQKDEVVMALAHGQMGSLALAQTMSQFIAGEIDVLVASSIVEYGLDSPHANNLVVLHAEWFGLSDLYQLRGRVGRRMTQASAHFLVGGVERDGYKTEELIQMTDTARKRLDALKEADTLGSGWSIALRDLEIRGGGNILGHAQHGNMETIGLLLYAQLLQEEMGRQAKILHIPLFQKKTD